MADTRCANPTYQLDVDTLMVEYSVHKTIESKIDSLRLQVADLSDNAADDAYPSHLAIEKKEESARLSQISDQLIMLFHHHHPNNDFSTGFKFNLKILEFLILLEQWIPVSSRTQLGLGSSWTFPNQSRPTYVYPPPIPNPLVEQIRRERITETVLRRNWLGLRYKHELALNNEPIAGIQKQQDTDRTGSLDEGSSDEEMNYDDIASLGPGMRSQNPQLPLDPSNEEVPSLQVGIANGKASNKRLGVVEQSHEVQQTQIYHTLFCLTLFELTPRFMDISAGIAQALGAVSNKWIELSCSLMWQSALERMQQMPENRYTKPSNTPFKMMRDDFGNRTWIEECFAWGSNSRPSRTPLERLEKELQYLGLPQESGSHLQDRLRSEDLICAMLTRDVDIDGDEDTIMRNLDNSTEFTSDDDHPKWHEIRTHYLDQLLDLIIEERPISDNVPFYHVVRRYCEASPIKPFLIDLIRYIEGVWNCNISSDVSGKPILVQIEEGGLEGMSSTDFEEFLDRVGLKLGQTVSSTGEVENVVRWN